MDKLERLIEYGIILFLGIFLDLMFFGPLIDSAVELGLNIETTINGVTAPTKDFFDPLVLNLYKLMWRLLEIIGWFVIIWSIIQYFKKFL